MFVFGVIAARGGSKGLPGKNIRLLGGEPLVAWSVEASKAAKSLDRTIVSTDDRSIAEAARRSGGEVPFDRPTELATDTAGMVGVLQHAVAWLEGTGTRPDVVVLLQATSPLRLPSEIDGTVQLILEGADSAQTVTEDRTHPLHRFKLEGGKLKALFVDPDSHDRRQDEGAIYRPNGSVFAMKRELLMNEGKLRGKDHRGLICPFETSVDVDDEWDLLLADLLLKRRTGVL